MAMKTDSFVSTFWVKKMSGFLQDQIEKFKQMIEKEYAQGEISDNDDDSGMSTNLDKASITQTGISPNKIPQ